MMMIVCVCLLGDDDDDDLELGGGDTLSRSFIIALLFMFKELRNVDRLDYQKIANVIIMVVNGLASFFFFFPVSFPTYIK